MGGVRCWKEVIDQMHALEHLQHSAVSALTLAISPAGSGYEPSEKDLETYITLTKPLADFLASLKSRALGEA